MVVVREHRATIIIVLNSGFSDHLLFVDGVDEPVHTNRGASTNPRTIRAAKIMRNMLLANIEAKL
jgi:hypothetical protein